MPPNLKIGIYRFSSVFTITQILSVQLLKPQKAHIAMKKRFPPEGPAILLLSAVYFVSYITRNSYNVVIAELVRQTGLAQSTLALTATGSLIAYGSGQLASGYLGDRFQPKKLILMGLTVTALMNLSMIFCRAPWLMLVFWCINGMAQAFLWPPLVRLMAYLFAGELYEKAVVAVTWGGSMGNIALYLGAPVLISLWGAESVFLGAALCAAVIVGVLWIRCPMIPDSPQKQTFSPSKGSTPLLQLPMVWFIFLTIILQGILRDGITTWTPVYINQTYQLGSSFSILSGAALPLMSLAAVQAASLLHRKWLHNPLVCAGVLFGSGALFGLLLFLFPSSHFALSVGLCALLTGCMHGVNLILICVLPAHFQRFGRVSLFSGLLNTFSYVGSALSTYGFAAAAELSGWRTVIASWPVISLAGMAVCLLWATPWKQFQREE